MDPGAAVSRTCADEFQPYTGGSHMKCPVCKDVNLVMTDRQGIEIDYYPECRGVWLDRGELDKIIERSAVQQPPARDRETYPDRSREHDRGDHRHKSKKYKSLLGELFDF
jgi:Zn-finger nucleic acid-binding protein